MLSSAAFGARGEAVRQADGSSPSLNTSQSLPDPSVDTPYRCVRTVDVSWPDPTWGELGGRIYWASGPFCQTGQFAPLARSPVVLFLQGTSFEHLEYNYLLTHLAMNGFVVLSAKSTPPEAVINCNWIVDNCVEDRAYRGLDTLRKMKGAWQYSAQVDYSNVGLVGHSKGGEAAALAAQIMKQKYPDLGKSGARAVVALAPTNGGKTDETVPIELGGHEARGFLVVYGSRDEDVMVQVAPGFGGEPMEWLGKTPFSLFDQAGSEATMEGFPVSTRSMLTKSMQFIYGANHLQFSDRTGHLIAPNMPPLEPENECQVEWWSAIPSPDQKRAARGYVTGFLRWFQRGDNYQSYFDGTLIDPFLVEAYPQYVPGAKWGDRRVIDNFQHDGSLSTIGGEFELVSTDGVEAAVVGVDYDPLLLQGPSTARHLAVEVANQLPLPIQSTLRWSIPVEKADFSGFEALSVRVGRGHPELGDPPVYQLMEGEVEIHFQLETEQGLSATVSSKSIGVIPSPDHYLGKDAVCGGANWYAERWATHLRTIRIPLASFGVPLNEVRAVGIVLHPHTMTGYRIHIDNLELTGGTGNVLP